MFTYLLLKALSVVLILAAAVYLLVRVGFVWRWVRTVKKSVTRHWPATFLVAVAAVLYLFSSITYPIHFAMPPWMQSHAPGGMPTSLPILNIVEFFLNLDEFERVDDIGADPTVVPALLVPDEDGIVRIELVAKEVLAEIAPNITFNYWTYNGTVPGPMLRVKEGDTVELTLTNDPSSLHAHNIDLHAVTSPGGGATLTNVEPGESKTFRWKALAPGLYEYHCAMANVSVHNAHGQYGLILVEPLEGLEPVDREFYVMQGELYTVDGLGSKGLQLFDSQAVIDGNPTYITFNGRVEDFPRMQANVGEKIRMYVGNGGINTISSFHVIGEIFDNVYVEGGLGAEPVHNIQTTIVPAGGAAIVEFTLEVPGRYVLVDHALARMNKGAWAVLEVAGEEDPDVYGAVDSGSSTEEVVTY